MGYYLNKKGYKLLNLETRTFFVSRDVIFREDIFPFKNADDDGPRVFVDVSSDAFNYDPLYGPLVLENEGNNDASEVEALPVNDSSDDDVVRITEPRRSSRVSIAPSWNHDYDISVNTAKKLFNCSYYVKFSLLLAFVQ